MRIIAAVEKKTSEAHVLVVFCLFSMLMNIVDAIIQMYDPVVLLTIH